MAGVCFTTSLGVKLRLLNYLTPGKEAAYVRTVC